MVLRWLALVLATGAAGADEAFPSVHALIGRVAGSEAALHFTLEEVPADTKGREQMSLRSDGQRVVVGGTSPVAAASAFNWYLNDFLNTTYDWSTYQVILPQGSLPLPASRLTRPRLVKWSYHLNVCTYGYSLAFVDWEYWQKHIDWMAMQGINLPLAFLGQEKVLQQAFARFNITFQELQHFISGPAFLPWFRMGNMQAWGGPISQAWIDDRVQLQKQVLGRMRELGMKAALPAFAGFVPPAFATKFPKANLTHSADWNRFPDPYGSVSLLEPTDPLFKQIGQAWVEEQTRLYGTDHVYQTDTYNEMNPRSTDLSYLASSSKAVIDAMQAGDKDAVWLMQGWLFLSGFWSNDRAKAYLSGVPNDKMIILDLDSSDRPIWTKTSSYFGKPFVFNTLQQNYGGQQGVTGNLPRIGDAFKKALAESAALNGVGVTMEGMWTNYITYDFTLLRPSLPQGALAAHAELPISMQLRVSPFRFGSIWSRMLSQLAPKAASVKAFRFDLVDVGREVLTEAFDRQLASLKAAEVAKDVSKAQTAQQGMLEVLDDLDSLLSTDENFMLGRWLAWAEQWAHTDAERQLLLFNARNQLTLWGPTGQILDYATKSWGGLVKGFFRPRWALFCEQVIDAIKSGKSFDQAAFNADVLAKVELPWQNSTEKYPSEPTQDAIEVSKALYQKYVATATLQAVVV
ncbi:NAGLU [Symbiodinium natans]|uniref:NAGLU protein n=1 Tax=Symbiodinium natans TaxID=878477 RepID=A0A812TIW0_9DINO|nr:NAGLU [Symbiodinium natans]